MHNNTASRHWCTDEPRRLCNDHSGRRRVGRALPAHIRTHARSAGRAGCVCVYEMYARFMQGMAEQSCTYARAHTIAPSTLLAADAIYRVCVL